MLATLGEAPLADPAWAYEPKYDGVARCSRSTETRWRRGRATGTTRPHSSPRSSPPRGRSRRASVTRSRAHARRRDRGARRRGRADGVPEAPGPHPRPAHARHRGARTAAAGRLHRVRSPAARRAPADWPAVRGTAAHAGLRGLRRRSHAGTSRSAPSATSRTGSTKPSTAAGFPALVNTSGSTGLHVYVPLAPRTDVRRSPKVLRAHRLADRRKASARRNGGARNRTARPPRVGRAAQRARRERSEGGVAEATTNCGGRQAAKPRSRPPSVSAGG